MIDLSPFERCIIFDKKTFDLFVKTIYAMDDRETLRKLFNDLNENQQEYLNYALSKAYSAIAKDNPSSKIGGESCEG